MQLYLIENWVESEQLWCGFNGFSRKKQFKLVGWTLRLGATLKELHFSYIILLQFLDGIFTNKKKHSLSQIVYDYLCSLCPTLSITVITLYSNITPAATEQFWNWVNITYDCEITYIHYHTGTWNENGSLNCRIYRKWNWMMEHFKK